MSNFTYEFPKNFDKRVVQLLSGKGANNLISAFEKCKYEYNDIGNAYYAGFKGNNWNMNALDFTFEGPHEDIAILQASNKAMREVIGAALMSGTTGYQPGHIYYLDEDIGNDAGLPSSNEERLNADIEAANVVLSDLKIVSEKICDNKKTYNGKTSENSINDGIRDLLSMKGYNEAKDQTRHGLSESGIDAGEVDLLLCRDGKEIAIIESVKLSSIDTDKINKHIKKAIINYNALGVATFIIAYVSTNDFGDFWKRYYDYLKLYAFPLTVKEPLEELTAYHAAMREAKMILSRDGYDFPVYFIALNI